MNLEKLLRENIRTLKPYTSARDDFSGTGMVHLDANENPYETGLNRYPDPYQRRLKREIAKFKGLSDQNLFLGNGSDEVIDLIIRAFCEPGEEQVLGLKPSYGMFQVSCDINNVEYKEIALNEDFGLDAAAVLAEVSDRTKVVFICSPNNPTGNTFDRSEIQKILNEFKGVVVLDEAYADFSNEESWSRSLDKYPQLIVVQTFSKALGLASARLGMAWCSVEMIEILNRIKPPYNINQLTEYEAIKRVQDKDKIEEEIESILEQRAVLTAELENLKTVVKVYPSQSNFILLRVNDAEGIYNALLSKGIVLRNRSKEYLCENCLRITVGTKEENKLLIKELKELENEESTVY